MEYNLLGEWGREIISLFILVPIVWFLLRQWIKSVDEISKELKEQTKMLSHLVIISEGHNNESREKFKMIEEKVSSSFLTDYQAIRVLTGEMWQTSRKKLEFLRNVLLNNHIKGREDFIKSKIRLQLLAFSEEYMTNFRTYNTKVGKLDKWVSANFTQKDFELFLDEVCAIMFRAIPKGEDKAQDAMNKKEEIALMMQTVQNTLAQKLRSDLQVN